MGIPPKIIIATIVIASLSGCASIVKGTTQKVPVASDPVGADVSVDGNPMGQTPTTVVLKRKNDHLLMIQKAGYSPKSVAIVKNVGGAVWGNVLAGGLIGWGVDAANGSQYNLVPATVSVKLDPSSEAAAVGGSPNASAEFVSKLKTLDELHDGKSLTDDEYARARVELFAKFMPEALPKGVDASQSSGTPPVANHN